MGRLRIPPILALLLALALVCPHGCGAKPASQEDNWRQEASSSLQRLGEQAAYRYRLELQTWVGVSGQSVSGSENGEGTYLDGDLTIPISRSSPAGEEAFTYTYWKDIPYQEEGGTWRAIGEEEVPSPLYDPAVFAGLVSDFGGISLEGEEGRDGTVCRRYLLRINGERAGDAFSPRAWSYFSNLRYEVVARVWVGDTAAPPVALQLEVTGFDQAEGLQRYRLLATLDPFDFAAGDIRVTPPPIAPGE